MSKKSGYAYLATISADVAKSTHLDSLLPGLATRVNDIIQEFADHGLNGFDEVIVNKDSGDGVLICFRDPLEAANAALSLKGYFLEKANAEIASLLGNQIDLLERAKQTKEIIGKLILRIGISFGRIEVKTRAKGVDVHSPCVALACRIQAANRTGRTIWADQSFAEALLRCPDSRIVVVPDGPKEIADFGTQVPVFAILSASPVEARWARKLTCFHQGNVIQYWCIASWFHRIIKDELQKEIPRAAIVHEGRESLKGALREKLQNAAVKTFSILREHFEVRIRGGQSLPRICLKGVNRQGNEDTVFDIARSMPIGYPLTESQIRMNSGFKKIVQTGQPYLCNNIPLAARKEDGDRYINPRLKPKKAANPKNDRNDSDWEGCWKSGQTDAGACYRSSLIVPVTLRGNDLDESFVKGFGLQPDKVDRAIYGFLCFDHVEINFFQPEDIEIGYMAADWLSLYILTQINYTTGSRTFARSERSDRPCN